MSLPLFEIVAVERRRAERPAGFSFPERRRQELDPLLQMALANAADAGLLRLVMLAAAATLVVALATSRLFG